LRQTFVAILTILCQ